MTSKRDLTPTPREGAVGSRNEAIERWERHRALGRGQFILRRGVGGWGIPAALLAIAYKLVQEQGFVRSPVLTHDLRVAIIVSLVIFPLCGYLFGRWLWETGEQRYRALTRGDPPKGR